MKKPRGRGSPTRGPRVEPRLCGRSLPGYAPLFIQPQGRDRANPFCVRVTRGGMAVRPHPYDPGRDSERPCRPPPRPRAALIRRTSAAPDSDRRAPRVRYSTRRHMCQAPDTPGPGRPGCARRPTRTSEAGTVPLGKHVPSGRLPPWLGLCELRSAGWWYRSWPERRLPAGPAGAGRATHPAPPINLVPPGRLPPWLGLCELRSAGQWLRVLARAGDPCRACQAGARRSTLARRAEHAGHAELHTVSMYILTPASCREQRPRACGTRRSSRSRDHPGGGPALTGPKSSSRSRPPPPAAATAAAAVLQLLPQPPSSSHLLPPQSSSSSGSPVATGSPASSSLEASVLPPGPAARYLPSPKATRRRSAPAVHPNRLGRGQPLQRPAVSSSAGRRRERGRDQSHWAREFNHAQLLRPAMKPTARARPWPAHCSEQRKGAGARRGLSRVAPQGSQRAARRRRSRTPPPSRLRGTRASSSRQRTHQSKADTETE